MWPRTSTDPLGRLLFERYGLHVLARPREDVGVLTVFPVADGASGPPGPLASLLGGGIAAPEIRRGERLADVSGTTSAGVSADLGLRFLEGFLTLLGAAGLAAKLSAAVARTRTRALRFRFGGASRDYVHDPFALDLALRDHRFDPAASPMRKGVSYYLATAVHRSEDVVFAALDEAANAVDFSAEVPATAAVRAGVKLSGSGELTVTADRPLPYGVELSRLTLNARRHRLELEMTRGYVHVRGPQPGELPGTARSMVGSPDDLMLLRFVD